MTQLSLKKKETRTFEVYFLERIRKTNDEHRSYLTVMRMRGMQIDEIIAKKKQKNFSKFIFQENKENERRMPEQPEPVVRT